MRPTPPCAFSATSRPPATPQHVLGQVHVTDGCHARRVEIIEWWPRLDEATQQWLIDNNRDVLPPSVVDTINGAGAEVGRGATLDAAERGCGGGVLSDSDVDWIERVANGET